MALDPTLLILTESAVMTFISTFARECDLHPIYAVPALLGCAAKGAHMNVLSREDFIRQAGEAWNRYEATPPFVCSGAS